MDSYLIMMYVTLQQETALKDFFEDQGWKFCKPGKEQQTIKSSSLLSVNKLSDKINSH